MLAARDVVHPGADLQQRAHERDLIAYGFEEELLEEIARFEPVAGVEMTHGFGEARVVLERRKHARRQVRLRRVFRAAAISVLLFLNLAFWGSLVLGGGLVKLLTFGELRRRVIRTLPKLAEQWVAWNDGIFDTFLTTRWEVEGFDGLRPDDHYLVISNHISWIDIFAVFRVFHRRAPLVRFFLKHTLAWAPFAGQAAWALGFPFMRRYSAEYLKQHPEKRGRDLETTRIACRRFRHLPVTILNYVEGTRFSEEKHDEQDSPYRYLLRPRVGGIGFVLASLAEQIDALYDVTIVYPTRDISMWDFLSNRLPWIRVIGRRIDVPDEFRSDAITEPGPARDHFRLWVEEIWRAKDDEIARILELHRG
jgi:1-acyl-sn-glycerol-3-phosphate acyltransferase